MTSTRLMISGTRLRTLLAVLLVYAFGVLPILAASHTHADEAAHASCQLCQASPQACEPPAPTLAFAPAPVSSLPPADASPDARRALPPAYESRGPPSA